MHKACEHSSLAKRLVSPRCEKDQHRRSLYGPDLKSTTRPIHFYWKSSRTQNENVVPRKSRLREAMLRGDKQKHNTKKPTCKGNFFLSLVSLFNF